LRKEKRINDDDACAGETCNGRERVRLPTLSSPREMTVAFSFWGVHFGNVNKSLGGVYLWSLTTSQAYQGVMGVSGKLLSWRLISLPFSLVMPFECMELGIVQDYKGFGMDLQLSSRKYERFR
jgi:hypothetical protein